MYDKTPQKHFGPGFSEASGAITFNGSEASGVTTGGTFGQSSGNLLFSGVHNLKVGDRIQLTQVTTLPSNLSTATNYWVIAVPTTSSITISETKSGTAITVAADGTADNTAQAFGPLEEITDAEMEASTGDWRKMYLALHEMMYQRINNTPSADRPSQVTSSRSSSANETTGVITRTYSTTFKVNASGIEVIDE